MFKVRASSILVVALVGLAGCGGTDSPSRLSGPSAPTAATVPSVPSAGIALSVTRGTTRGGTGINLTGAQLRQGATVAFGTTTVKTYFDPQYQHLGLFVDTPAHTAGLINVTIVNPDGETFLLSQGFEYAPPESFHFNGEWLGATDDSADIMYFDFTIRNNVLVTASCEGESGGVTTVTLSTPVRNGEFASGLHEGFELSGRITSGFQARGQITAPCSSGNRPYRVVLNDH